MNVPVYLLKKVYNTITIPLEENVNLISYRGQVSPFKLVYRVPQSGFVLKTISASKPYSSSVESS